MRLAELLTAVSIALLAAVMAARLRGERRPQERLFALAALVMAAAQASLLLMLFQRDPSRVPAHYRAVLACLIVFPAIAIPFFASFGRPDGWGIPARRLPWILGGAGALALAAAFAPPHTFVEGVHFAPDGHLWALTFSPWGKAGAAYVLVANIAILHLFENTYRSATVADRVTLKYPFLGLIIASLITFVVMSRVLAISALERSFLFVHACGVIVLCVTFLYASLRYPLFGLRIAVPRRQPPSVVSISVAGLYLLALGLITMLARLLGLAYDRFLVAVLGIFAVFMLLALLISGKAKRRLRTFLSENFYLQRYNYRKEWRRYAEIMAAGTTIEEFLTNVVSSLCDTMMVRRGLIWADVEGGKAAFFGSPDDAIDAELVRELIRLTARRPAVVFRTSLPAPAGEGRNWSWVRAAARLGQGEEARGLVVLGDKDLGRSYSDEDEDFLALIAYQATLALDNMLMEERIIESRQMESFNRFASFVVHDLKNTVGMLSLMAENARDNIGSPDFQRDALDTIQRSVDKMRTLITSLSTHKMPATISKTEIDLSALVRRAAEALRQPAGTHGAALACEVEEGIRARVDPSAVNRVIENLALNAFEAAPPGATVTLRIERAESVWARISVRDTGPGFDPAFLREHLFHPFRSTKKSGLGVGLVLCKSLVEAHGGRLSIESEPGAGSVVTVMLPALPAAGS